MTDEPHDTTDEPTQNQGGSDARSEDGSERPDAADQSADAAEQSGGDSAAGEPERAAESAEQAARDAERAAASARRAVEDAGQTAPADQDDAGSGSEIQHVEVEATEQPTHVDELKVKKEIVEGATSDTTSTRTRHWLTNDIIAGILHISLVLLVLGDAFGTINLKVLPPRIRLLYIGVVASAAIWTFGQGVVEAIRS